METKTPGPSIELSNYEKGGIELATKTDEPEEQDNYDLGVLANEDWIVSLGSANAHDLHSIHANKEKKARLDNRLSASSTPRPWKSLPSQQMTVLNETYQSFEDSLGYDDPDQNDKQRKGLIRCISMFNRMPNTVENEIMYDTCTAFLSTIFPLLESFERHCDEVHAAGKNDPRNKVRMEIGMVYTAYTRGLEQFKDQTRDDMSDLWFGDLALPISKESKSVVDVSSIDISGSSNSNNNVGGGIPISTGSVVNIRMGNNNGSSSASQRNNGSIMVEDNSNNQMNYGFCERRCPTVLFSCLGHIPFFQRLTRAKRRKDYTNYLDPEVSLGDIAQNIKYEQHKLHQHRKKLKEALLMNGDVGSDDNENEYHGDLSMIRNVNGKSCISPRCANMVDIFFTALIQKVVILFPFVSLMIMLFFRFGLDSETFFPFVPQERDHIIKYMLLGSCIADLSTTFFLPLYFFLASRRGHLNETSPGDRLTRIRPILVMLANLCCGTVALRYSVDSFSIFSVNLTPLEDLIPFATASIFIHTISIVLIYSIMKGFIKKKIKKSGNRTTFNVVCMCSYHRCLEKGNCFKAAYRADVSGEGLAELLTDKADNERQIASLMSSPDWNKTISTRRKVRFYRQEAKLYRKAVKSMKVEIAVHMMTILYKSIEKAQLKALPCEICVAAVFFVSYHNIKKHVLRLYKIRHQIEKVLAMDAVWKSLITRYDYALKSENKSFIKSCTNQLKIYMQKDRDIRNINRLNFQTKERLQKLANLSNFSGLIGGIGIRKRDRDRDAKNAKESKGLDSTPPMPSSKLVYDGIIGREDLYKQLLSMQAEQMALNSRISQENMENLQYKHEDWSAAAAAANSMNVLHKGWSCRYLRTSHKGKKEYVYFNRKLNAKLNQRIVSGITKKQMPEYLELQKHKIPHSTMFTSKNIFETFQEVLRINSPRYRNSRQHARSEHRVQQERILFLTKQEFLWRTMEKDVSTKLRNYITVDNENILDSYNEIQERLEENVKSDIDSDDSFDLLGFGSDSGSDED